MKPLYFSIMLWHPPNKGTTTVSLMLKNRSTIKILNNNVLNREPCEIPKYSFHPIAISIFNFFTSFMFEK